MLFFTVVSKKNLYGASIMYVYMYACTYVCMYVCMMRVCIAQLVEILFNVPGRFFNRYADTDRENVVVASVCYNQSCLF